MNYQGLSASDVNREYYGRSRHGREDYWRKMAAPRHRVAVLLRALRDADPGSVIDLGCGNGVLLSEIRRRHPEARLCGLDLSPEQIAENQRLHPWAAWRIGNLERPLDGEPSLGDAFDVVVAAEVIEHVDRPEQLLRNAHALARPGGRLLLSTQSGPIRATELRVGHTRHFSAPEMRDLLSRTGWEPTQVWNTGFPFHDLSKWYANRDPDASMARFGDKPYGWKENLVCFALRVAFRLNSRRRGAQLFAIARRT